MVDKLARIQHEAAVMISGAFRATSKAALNVELFIPPIELTLQQHSSKACARLASLPDSHAIGPHIQAAFKKGVQSTSHHHFPTSLQLLFESNRLLFPSGE